MADTYFHVKDGCNKLVSNSLLIDMERKVIDNVVGKKEAYWQYDSGMTICREEGSGNNWAYGFNEHGLQCLDEILQKYRKLTERLDSVEGIIVL